MSSNGFRGFTLIELMIVVAVVGILAMIAIPTFKEQASKSRRSDAITGLSSLQLAQARWRTNNPSYSPTVTNPGLPGSATQYDYYVMSVASASGTGFKATATPKTGGAQVGDECGTYVMSVTGNSVDKLVSGATLDAKSCWSR